MYQIEALGSLLRSPTKLLAWQASRPQVSRTVVFLGLTSLFTDISAEMVSAILPMYLVLHLQLSPLAFGFIDGLYQGAAALLRVASGLVADRWHRQKEVAAAGYGLSAICKLGLLAAGGSLAALAAVVFVDRTGKGIRTAPRDAMISLSSPPSGLATAFGVHRALDTTGAMLGPLLAFGLLALVPRAFDAIFVTSFCVALVGVGLLVLFVENPPQGGAPGAASGVSVRAAAGLLRIPRFAGLVVAATALGLVTLSDGFIYLSLQRRMDFSPTIFPLLYVATAMTYLLLAVPVGRLADVLGRGRVFIGGYALLIPVYVTLMLLPIGTPTVVMSLLLLGIFYAATDGVLMALASTLLPSELRASGLALLTTATNLARLAASVIFGALWTWTSLEGAAATFLVGLLAAVALTAVVLARDPEGASNVSAY